MRASWWNRPFQGTVYRPDTRNQFPGVYRARVEYDLDPLKRGRIKFRIPQLHGIPDETDSWLNTSELPWAEPGFMFSGPDMGSFVTPVIGSTTYIMFEGGDPNFPIYFGGIHGVKIGESKPMGVVGNVPSPSQVPVGKWGTSESSEVPQDVFDGIDITNPSPTRKVYFKSMKGHTLVAEDNDELEAVTLIDRAGQMFKMISPVLSSVNRVTSQAFQRGLKNVQDGSQFLYSQLVDSKAVIFIKDVANQFLRLTAQQGAEKVELVSQNLTDQSYATTRQSGAKGSVQTLMIAEDKTANNTVYIELNATDLTVSIVLISNGEQVSKIDLTSSSIVLNASSVSSSSAITTVASSLSSDSTTWVDNKDEDYVTNLR